MNEGIKKFRELLLTDEDFQKKLREATAAYTGEQTAEAVFNNVLLPLGEEYGLSATFEDFKEYVEHFSAEQEMSTDELEQVAGGTKGIGVNLCYRIGLGLGDTDPDDSMYPTLCFAVGIGEKTGQACMVNGTEFL